MSKIVGQDRKLYLVTVTGGYAEGHLIVRSDSPEGAASFLQLRLRDDEVMSSDVGPVTYLVSEENDDIGDGLWLSGYDSSDDLEDLLARYPREWSTAPRLWKEPVEVVL